MSRLDHRAAQHLQRGNDYAESGLHPAAIHEFERALRIAPGTWFLHYNIGNSRLALGQLDRALVAYDEAARFGTSPHLHHNRALVLRDLNRRSEARDACLAALALDPGFADARHTLGCVSLAIGDFARGLSNYESRFDCSDGLASRLLADKLPTWRGEDLAGKHILVHTEQGHGDTIQFCRFLPFLLARGARVTVYALPRMHAILSTLHPFIQFTGEVPDDLSGFDYVSPLMSLPLHLGTRLDTVPAPISYLRTDPDRVAHWRERIGPAGFRVGIAWQGNPKNANDAARSFPVTHFAPLANVPGVRLISLQVGAASEQIKGLPWVESLGDGFDAGPDSFMDTAAAMESLDLIIGADSAVIHLAGALGRPVWVPLRFAADWRWLQDRPDSPWYPTMTLYRQSVAGDWASVFDRMIPRLAGQANRDAAQRKRDAAPLMLPGSIGELIDKRTILEIKAERITDPGKLANVRRELDALRRVEADHVSTCRETVRLAALLREVNTALWEIEDRIRDLESRRDFGPAFIETARAVYIMNDKRAALKRELNTLHGSTIVEEKSYAGPNLQQGGPDRPHVSG